MLTRIGRAPMTRIVSKLLLAFQIHDASQARVGSEAGPRGSWTRE